MIFSWKFIIAVTVIGIINNEVLCVLPPSENQYNVLMLLPFASKSHRNVFMPIAEGLAERGHKVRLYYAYDYILPVYLK